MEGSATVEGCRGDVGITVSMGLQHEDWTMENGSDISYTYVSIRYLCCSVIMAWTRAHWIWQKCKKFNLILKMSESSASNGVVLGKFRHLW